MKSRFNKQHTLLLSICLLAFSLVMSCNPDDEPLEDAQVLALRALAGDWTLGDGAGYIRVDGVDVSANYEGFSLFFTTGIYLTTNGKDLFRARGTWEWIDENATMVHLDDGKEIKIVQLTDRRLTVTFNLSDGGARAGIPGNYEVSVVR